MRTSAGEFKPGCDWWSVSLMWTRVSSLLPDPQFTPHTICLSLPHYMNLYKQDRTSLLTVVEVSLKSTLFSSWSLSVLNLISCYIRSRQPKRLYIFATFHQIRLNWTQEARWTFKMRPTAYKASVIVLTRPKTDVMNLWSFNSDSERWTF